MLQDVALPKRRGSKYPLYANALTLCVLRRRPRWTCSCRWRSRSSAEVWAISLLFDVLHSKSNIVCAKINMRLYVQLDLTPYGS